jgi:hypothetical protein
MLILGSLRVTAAVTAPSQSSPGSRRVVPDPRDDTAAITRASARALAAFLKRFLERPPGLKAKSRPQKSEGSGGRRPTFGRRPALQATARGCHDAQAWPSGGVAAATGVASGRISQERSSPSQHRPQPPSAPSALVARPAPPAFQLALPGLGLVKSSTLSPNRSVVPPVKLTG